MNQMNNKWTENKVFEELKIVIKQIGHFPTTTELKNLKRNDLICAIRRFGKGDGFFYFQKMFNFTSSRWWTESKIIDELGLIVKKIGHFPTLTELMQEKRSDLIGAIRRDKRGLFYFQKKFGFEQTRKEANYWEKNIDKELQEVIQKLNRFPTQIDLCNLGKSQLYNVIKKTGCNLNDYRIKFGFPIIERNKNYWICFDNLTREIKSIMNNDEFPSTTLIEKKLGGGAIRSIAMFGGVSKVAQLMGYNSTYFYTTSDGHYVHSSNEYLFDEFLYSRGIPHEVNGLIPNSKFRYDFKIGELFFEIWGFNCNLKQKINQEYNEKRKKKEYCYDSQGLKLISIEFDVFEKPLDAIENYFVNLMSNLGFDTLAKMTNYSLHSVVNNIKIWNEDKIIVELNKVISEIGRFPRMTDLKKINSPLIGAVTKYGGFNYFADKMGYECRKKSGYWTEEKIIEELTTIIENLGKFPSKAELRSLHSKLYYAIYDNNGWEYFEKRFIK